jgi:cytochrome c553
MSLSDLVRASVLALAAGLVAASAARAATPFEDSMAQRVLACTGCHGAQGRSAPDGYYPRIAGKPAGYLFHQLQNFRDARRQYAPMTRLLATLDDRYLREIADHFARLDLPYAAPPASAATAEALVQGRALTVSGDAARELPACSACHGPALTGVAPAVPGLLGLPRDYLVSQLGAWRDGSRRAHAPDCMADIARRMSPQEIVAVAQWLSAQPVPANAHALASTAALAKALPLQCGSIDGAAR